METDMPDRAAGFRDRMIRARRKVQDELQAFPLAYSTDGRTFAWQTPVTFDITAGGYIRIETRDGAQFLGRVVTKDVVTREGPEIGLQGDESLLGGEDVGQVSHMAFRVVLRYLEGTGNILGRFDGDTLLERRDGDRFEDAVLSPATDADVEKYLRERLTGRATLDIGKVNHGNRSAPALLNAAGFNRHTFLCGQSGSGKTYSLGVMLERILLETSIRVVIVDPNSDYVRLGELRPAHAASSHPQEASMRSRYEAIRSGIRVLRPKVDAASESETLRIRFSNLGRAAQGIVLGLDPLRDRGEYNVFRSLADRMGDRPYGLEEILAAVSSEFSAEHRDLGLRIENLGVAAWDVWAGADQAAVIDHRDDWRAMVLDVGGFTSQQEKSVVAMAVLEAVWRLRGNREPVLIVIDEAHNVCPAEPQDALQATATDHAIRIAAEGRKFGLHLLLASQRPDKLDRNVLSQCDNLVLMRMNSRDDIGHLESIFSFVPPSLLAQSTTFVQGESLIAGKIVPSPLLARFGTRITQEGGSDVPATWASPESGHRQQP